MSNKNAEIVRPNAMTKGGTPIPPPLMYEFQCVSFDDYLSFRLSTKKIFV